MIEVLFAVVLAPFILAILVPAIRKWTGSRIGLAVLPVPIVLFAWFLAQIPTISRGQVLDAAWLWVPALKIGFSLQLDGWSLLFGLLVTGIGFLVILYSYYYLGAKEDLTKFYLYILAFMGSMLGVVLSANLILTYVFWEFTSFTSFLLIGFWSVRERSKYGAQKALLITALGGFMMLTGFALIYLVTGSFDLRTVLASKEAIMASPYYPYILTLVLIGAFTKSAQVPFHIWLPNAMEAPTPISAYLHSATMVKAGLFLVGRLFPVLGGTELWFYVVSGVGVVTMITGSVLAVKQDDLKALLAYSTISQLGLIMLLFGIGTPFATAAAVFHLFNHAAFKGALFMVVGIIDHETGSRDINLFGGLGKKMPVSAAVTGVAALSMAGLPPLAGFVSKELFYEATLETGFHGMFASLLPTLAVAASVFTFAYSAMLFFYVFFGQPRGETPSKPHEAPGSMLFGPVVLAAITFIVGLFPEFFGGLIINPAVASIRGEAFKEHYALWHGVTTPLVMSLLTVGFGAVIYLLIEKVRVFFKTTRSSLTPNRVYDWLVDLASNGSRKFTARYMTGSLRDYVVYILAVFSAAVGITWLLKVRSTVSWEFAPVNLYEVALVAILAIAVITVLRANSRILALIALGVVGFVVSAFWVVFRAPDLALTQLIVETIGLILFLLVFYYLPSFFRDTDFLGKRVSDTVVSTLFGLVVAGLALSAHGTRIYDSIGSYYIENSLKLGGGHNIVNVILVDFRGLDTMGEITVLSIAAMGVYALIKLRRKDV